MKIRVRKSDNNTFILKRLIVLVFLLAFLFANFSYASRASGGSDPVVLWDFEKCKANADYTNVIENGTYSNLSTDSKVMVVTGDSALSGRASLKVDICDLRWEDFHAEDKSFIFSFSFKLDKSFAQSLQFMISTQDSLTDLESEAGVVLSIKNDASGNPILQGADMTVLRHLKWDTFYEVELAVERGTDKVYVSVNGEELSKTFRFISRIYFIDGLRISSAYEEDVSRHGFWTVDDIQIATKGRSYEQMFSVQSPGSYVPISLPKADSESSFRVFVNGTQIGISDYYVSSQTIYLSAAQFFRSIGVSYKYNEEQKLLNVENERVKVCVSVPGSEAEINGVTVTLTNPVRLVDNVVMISPNFINEVFNAKVWWDQSANLLLITTGTYKNDGILRKISSKLYMNGEPYYTVGYNGMDLFEDVLSRYLNPANTTVESWTKEAEALLTRLKQSGVRTVRISCASSLLPDFTYDDVSMGKYLEAMDALMDILDTYEIQAVVCLDLSSSVFLSKELVPRYGWISGNEVEADLVAKSASESRNVMYAFVEKFVTRYKNRNTILMYEISNGANLLADTGAYHKKATYSLAQLASFYTDCAKLIRQYDSQRLVASGDAMLLPYQWSLYQHTMDGKASGQVDAQGLTVDMEETFLSVLWLLNESLDVISIQTPDEAVHHMNAFYNIQSSDSDVRDYLYYLQVSSRLGKALYNSSATNQTGLLSLDNAISCGVQLSFWKDLPDEAFAQGNLDIQTRNMINMAESENTDVIWKGSSVDVFNPADVIADSKTDDRDVIWNSFVRFAVLSAVLVLVSCLILFAFRNKRVV